jgi:hypothetical protein
MLLGNNASIRGDGGEEGQASGKIEASEGSCNPAACPVNAKISHSNSLLFGYFSTEKDSCLRSSPSYSHHSQQSTSQRFHRRSGAGLLDFDDNS